MSRSPAGVEVSLLAALAGAAATRGELLARLATAGVGSAQGEQALSRLRDRGLVAGAVESPAITAAGADALLAAYGEIAAALDPSPGHAGQQECPSLPWLTSIETEWIEALSFNYAVDPGRLAALLPAPLVPELHQGTAWVQVLISSLRELRPQGMPAPFGVCFYQVSYRAAVCFRDAAGALRRGGYFVHSETNDPLMRAIGNRLAEFKFHAFGAAEVVMLRQGATLSVGVDPAGVGSGRLAAVVDTTPLPNPPAESRWRSLAELQEPLVDCFDAFGVDPEEGFLYTLTIDRGPWNARFVRPLDLYCDYFVDGPLGGGAASFDSLLHVRQCRYRWRPLRRERLPAAEGR